jgi:L-fucose mutarotase/ribose pyranase (RbsD/FucU family)
LHHEEDAWPENKVVESKEIDAEEMDEVKGAVYAVISKKGEETQTLYEISRFSSWEVLRGAISVVLTFLKRL